MPADLMAEIVLPDVEHATDDAEHVRRAELARALAERVEMPVPVRPCRRADGPGVGRQIGIAVEPVLANRVDHVHPGVQRPGGDAARRRGDVDGLRATRNAGRDGDCGNSRNRVPCRLSLRSRSRDMTPDGLPRRSRSRPTGWAVHRQTIHGRRVGAGAISPGTLAPDRPRQIGSVDEAERSGIGVDADRRRLLAEQRMPAAPAAGPRRPRALASPARLGRCAWRAHAPARAG